MRRRDERYREAGDRKPEPQSRSVHASLVERLEQLSGLAQGQPPALIRDVDQLKGLFDLFAATLQRLCEIGSAYEQDPGISV